MWRRMGNEPCRVKGLPARSQDEVKDWRGRSRRHDCGVIRRARFSPRCIASRYVNTPGPGGSCCHAVTKLVQGWPHRRRTVAALKESAGVAFLR